jgi:hypothetical protein
MSVRFRSAETRASPSAEHAAPGPGDAPIDLVRRAHPERLRACLDPRIGPATATRLQEAGRFRARLDALLMRHFTPPAPETVAEDAGSSEAEAALASILARAEPTEAARLAGAIWHAGSLKRLVSGPAVGELVGRIGRRAHACGVRNAAAAVATAPIADPAALAAAVERDGLLCLGAAAVGSPRLRLHLLMMLPLGTPAEAERFSELHRANAPVILVRVAAELDEPRHAV